MGSFLIQLPPQLFVITLPFFAFFSWYVFAVVDAVDGVKLFPLPPTPLRARTDARTNSSTQRATRLRSVLAHVYAVARQNQITTTVP
jgi:hypothetical protein